MRRRTEPTPGDFYLAQNIDDLLFAFDAFSSPGQAPLENETGVCAWKCATRRSTVSSSTTPSAR